MIGVAALAALALHGSAWIAYRTVGALNERALRFVKLTWWLVAPLTALITVVTFNLLPHLFLTLRLHPLGLIFPITAVAGLGAALWFAIQKRAGAAFASSSTYLLGMLTSVAFSLYPSVLPSSTNPTYGGLTIQNAKAADYGLRIGLVWWVLGMALAVSYTIFNYRTTAGKISAETPQENESY
jgi:cytochrome d ubiquinol oxidase subunit II